MTIVDVVLIVIGVLNIMFMTFMMSLIKDVVSIKLLITQLHTATSTLASRSINQELMINKLGQGFSEFVNLATSMIDKVEMAVMGGGSMLGGGRIYRTTDGKFTATSLDELMNKIKNSGKEEDYTPLTQDDMDKLRNLFEQSDEDEDEDNYDTQR